MVENYIVEEAMEFYSEFIAGVSSIGLNSSVIKRDSNVDRALSASSFIRPNNIWRICVSLTLVALALEVPQNSITHSLRWIAHGPSPDMATYSGYMINGYYYHTKGRDDIRRVQNSGVSIIATKMEIHRWRIAVRMKERNASRKDWESFVDARLSEEWEKITHDVSYRSTLWKEARKGRNNDYFDDATQDCASRIDELVATHKNEKILTDTLGSKEHGGRVRGAGEEDDSRCKSDKKRSNHSRSSIGSINIDLDADKDLVNTPSNKGVEHSTTKDVVYSSNYTDVNGTIKLLNRHVVNNIKDVYMIHIPMNELIFESYKFVYLAREDLLHYCGMVEIDYMCILAYITYLWVEYDCVRKFFVIDQSKISSHIKDRDLQFRNLANQLEATNLEQKMLISYNISFRWMSHVIDLRENCVYALDSLRSKVNEDIHGVINVGLKTWQAKHDLQCYRSTPKWRFVKCPLQLDFVGYGYYVQKYIHEIAHNYSTFSTGFFNTKSAYRQEEVDEIRTKWIVLYGSVEKCAGILDVGSCAL
ncbi:uncharacterized protein E5676_scaffold111G00120 [Cucumis melo var. makuwa]|uniref:Transposase n=1 Tax=Cucumis melo var. makuwa TaxID=1194695 RepID=A0A5D3DR84_CUCMM|nr:uncharacterized protein E6C27_scaffold54G001100 [Cucumis melo var. makuwa]TYK26104.1 uncharacterized protein E5676_scaffold111G00120 [Cucumis melo var. makuwa]